MLALSVGIGGACLAAGFYLGWTGALHHVSHLFGAKFMTFRNGVATLMFESPELKGTRILVLHNLKTAENIKKISEFVNTPAEA